MSSKTNIRIPRLLQDEKDTDGALLRNDNGCTDRMY